MDLNPGTQAPASAAPSAAQSAASSAAPAAPEAAPWTASLPPEIKNFVEFKGFKDPGSLASAYQNLEKLSGFPPERLLKLPEKSDAPEWQDIYDRMGRPKAAEEYMLATPEGGDEGATKWAAENFHKLGLSRGQAEKLFTGWNEYAKSQADAVTQKMQAQIAEGEQNIKREWGMKYEENMSAARKAAEAFGLDGKALDGLEATLGYEKTIKLLNAMGSKFSEASYVTSSGQPGFKGVMTPAAAQGQIQGLKGDTDFIRRLSSGDMEARERWDNLHKYAYPNPT